MRNQESHLGHIHAGVTAQWPDSGEVIGPQQGGDYSVLVDLPDHGGINEVHKPVLVHGDTWGGKHGDGIFVSLFVVLCFDGRMVCGGDGGNRTLGMMCLDQGPYWDGRASFRTVTLSAFKASISQGLCAVTCTILRVLALSLNPPTTDITSSCRETRTASEGGNSPNSALSRKQIIIKVHCSKNKKRLVVYYSNTLHN